MTYVDPDDDAPLRRALGELELAADTSAPSGEPFVVPGQGTATLTLNEPGPFTITFRASRAVGVPALRWRVDHDGAILSRSTEEGGWEELGHFAAASVDPEPLCPYWFSVDCHNRALRYGKGEMRLGTTIAAHLFEPRPPAVEPDPCGWLAALDRFEIDVPTGPGSFLWRDPVTAEPPMRVVSHDTLTMADIAYGRVTVPASLTPTCQKLYDNVAGARFLLDTPDFPDFSAAIEASIRDPDGWCAKVLKRKADEFGSHDVLKTYLRITLGLNQGESPGIPYVMEIWPSGHYSPIHNHGGADAVIRVLHGAITVSLYPMLSPHHETPFATKTFVKDDVTWISERLNQVHMLKNHDPAVPCITIQCYLYADDNRTHWPYFDYLEPDGIGHFDPNSDADFLTFKQLMQQEWSRR